MAQTATYNQIATCTDLGQLKALKSALRPKLYGPHGAKLTEAQNKYQAIIERIAALESVR